MAIQREWFEAQNETIERLQAENEKLVEALTECVEWLDNAPFDYSNGITYQGSDEGDVLGWNGHTKIVNQARAALAAAKG